MLYTKIQPQSFLGLGSGEDFKVFYHNTLSTEGPHLKSNKKCQVVSEKKVHMYLAKSQSQIASRG